MRTHNHPAGSHRWQFAIASPAASFDATLRPGDGPLPTVGALAARMGRIIAATEGLRLCAPVRANVCYFSAAPDDAEAAAEQALNARIRLGLPSQEVVFSQVLIDGRSVIRAAITHRASAAHIKDLIAELVRARKAQLQARSSALGYHRDRWLRQTAAL